MNNRGIFIVSLPRDGQQITTLIPLYRKYLQRYYYNGSYILVQYQGIAELSIYYPDKKGEMKGQPSNACAKMPRAPEIVEAEIKTVKDSLDAAEDKCRPLKSEVEVCEQAAKQAEAKGRDLAGLEVTQKLEEGKATLVEREAEDRQHAKELEELLRKCGYTKSYKGPYEAEVWLLEKEDEVERLRDKLAAAKAGKQKAEEEFKETFKQVEREEREKKHAIHSLEMKLKSLDGKTEEQARLKEEQRQEKAKTEKSLHEREDYIFALEQSILEDETKLSELELKIQLALSEVSKDKSEPKEKKKAEGSLMPSEESADPELAALNEEYKSLKSNFNKDLKACGFVTEDQLFAQLDLLDREISAVTSAQSRGGLGQYYAPFSAAAAERIQALNAQRKAYEPLIQQQAKIQNYIVCINNYKPKSKSAAGSPVVSSRDAKGIHTMSQERQAMLAKLLEERKDLHKSRKECETLEQRLHSADKVPGSSSWEAQELWRNREEARIELELLRKELAEESEAAKKTKEALKKDQGNWEEKEESLEEELKKAHSNLCRYKKFNEQVQELHQKTQDNAQELERQRTRVRSLEEEKRRVLDTLNAEINANMEKIKKLKAQIEEFGIERKQRQLKELREELAASCGTCGDFESGLWYQQTECLLHYIIKRG